MQPNEQPQPNEQSQPQTPPAAVPFASPAAATPAPTGPSRKRKILAIWLLVGPTVLIIGSLLLYAIANFALSSMSTPGEGELFADSNPLMTIINIALFLVGAVSVITWLPGIVIGIVLLASKK